MKTAKHISAVLLFVATLLSASCVKSYPDGLTEQEYNSLRYVNSFAKTIVDQYYLWKAEVQEDIDSWKVTDDPIGKVNSIRYTEDGALVDRWTRMTDDYELFMQKVDGNAKTLGLNIALYWSDEAQTSICAVVNYVYPGSPAEQAGLHRGDVITFVNGRQIPKDDYQNFISANLLNADSASLELRSGLKVELEAVQMYCDPLVHKAVFDCAGTKVAYLFYTSYTLDSRDSLKKAFSEFKEAGVSELILDLRYNGGGYDAASRTLASLIAPREVVENEKVFNTEIYNENLSEYFTNWSTFDPDCLDANIDARKLYVLMTGNTASASESTICGLSPYMEVVKIGKQSSGKFCGGYIFEGSAWYDEMKSMLTVSDWENGKKYAANWGIYVMASRYADCNGNTPCMPNGFTPDVEVEDNPVQSIPIGDPQEQMLHAALTLAGYDFSQAASLSSAPALLGPSIEMPLEFHSTGILLLN